MSNVDILVPDLSESVADAAIATWRKKPGDTVVRDEVLVEIETDKVVLEVLISADGVLDVVLEDEGTTVVSRQILSCLCESNSAGKETSAKPEEKMSIPAQRQQASLEEQNNDALSLTIRRLLAERNPDANAIKGTSVDDHLAHGNVEKHLAKAPAKEPAPAAAVPVAQPVLTVHSEKYVSMTRLRKRVAERLLEAKDSTAMLTTFNRINMKPIMNLRKQYGGMFEKRYGIRLGFIPLYAKTVVEALKRHPEVSASADGGDVVYHSYSDVSMAVSMPYGLATPVLCDADTLDIVDIERKIKELTVKSHDSKLTIGDLTGGNFTIINDDVSGSLMSTPIINLPQNAVLGMHAIKGCPTTMSGQVETLPMMYLALSCGHCLIDDRESVGFLVTIEGSLEDSTYLLLDVWQPRFHLHCRPDKTLSPSSAIGARRDAGASYQTYGTINVDRVKRKCRI